MLKLHWLQSNAEIDCNFCDNEMKKWASIKTITKKMTITNFNTNNMALCIVN